MEKRLNRNYTFFCWPLSFSRKNEKKIMFFKSNAMINSLLNIQHSGLATLMKMSNVKSSKCKMILHNFRSFHRRYIISCWLQSFPLCDCSSRNCYCCCLPCECHRMCAWWAQDLANFCARTAQQSTEHSNN